MSFECEWNYSKNSLLVKQENLKLALRGACFTSLEFLYNVMLAEKRYKLLNIYLFYSINLKSVPKSLKSGIFRTVPLISVYCFVGILTTTSVPCPTTLFISIFPPFLSKISFAIERPKPVPPISLVRALSTL